MGFYSTFIANSCISNWPSSNNTGFRYPIFIFYLGTVIASRPTIFLYYTEIAKSRRWFWDYRELFNPHLTHSVESLWVTSIGLWENLIFRNTDISVQLKACNCSNIRRSDLPNFVISVHSGKADSWNKPGQPLQPCRNNHQRYSQPSHRTRMWPISTPYKHTINGLM